MDMTLDEGAFRLPRPANASRKIKMGVQGHFTGSLVVGDDEGYEIEFESHTERNVALVTLARPNVAALESQVPFKWINPAGAPSTHFFDFRVLYSDGTRAVLIVKNGRKAAQASFHAEMAHLASQVTSDLADRVSLVTEKHIDPVELYNAELIHSVRRPDPEPDAAVLHVIAKLAGAARIGEIVHAAGFSGRGFRAVVRLIRKHELELVSHERIGRGSFVRRRSV
ncbi:MAG: hypothetical protein ACU0E9_11925 [Limimaricola soesokkakensis]|uniref:hypothetical protein n=1 Tax=Limimaricola soesokkakensis TaxID=1343159 RepID=UPI004058CDD0